MITVVVPIFNMEKYLDKSIPALLNQTYTDYELILVDDGSTDKSLKICDRFAGGRENVRVYHKENGGVSSARNWGLDHAKGEYIIFPDPDDVVEPEYLENLMALHEKYSADLEICGHYVDFGEKERVWNVTLQEGTLDRLNALHLLMKWNCYCGYTWNKLFHMDMIRKHGLRFDEEALSIQDLIFCFCYLRLCDTVAYNPKPLYHYNRNTGVTSALTPLTDRKMSVFQAYVKLAEIAKDEYPEIADAAYSSLFNKSMSCMYTYYLTGMKEQEQLEILKDNLRQYSRWFFSDPEHSRKHKLLGRVAMVSPRIYYVCSKVLRRREG